MPFLIAITGGSGSGKTLLSTALRQKLPYKTKILSYDNYYRDNTALSMEERCAINYDSPQSLEEELFIEHLRKLKKNQAIEMPEYDFAEHNRKKRSIHYEPEEIILCEGIMVMQIPPQYYDMTIFVDASSDVRLSRRILRDVASRGRSVESVISQYFATVRPMHQKYIAPCKAKADFVFHNDGTQGIDESELARLISEIINKYKKDI